ncbi:MAG TPA: cardiolipin synthase [Candidatus Cloacimonadota bacterium]|nr:cardiolipin synthase [Candidatus Cloacimonadota bacterium]
MLSHKIWDAVVLILMLSVVLLFVVSVANLLIKGSLGSFFTVLTMRIINIVFGITIFLIILIMVMENSNPVHTLAWILVLVYLPVIGFFLYLFFGRNWRKSRLFSRKGLSDSLSLRDLLGDTDHSLVKGEIAIKLSSLLESNSKAILSLHNKLRIISDTGEAFEAILERIASAKHHIFLEYFSIARDETGKRLKQLLIQKAVQGVEIRLIYDDVGSWKLGHRYKADLHKAGVKLQAFMPVWIPFLNSKLNYRNHRKIVVVDGWCGYLGGLNIGDQYLGKSKYFGYWRDTQLEILGEGALSLQAIFLTDWFFSSHENLLTLEKFGGYKPSEQDWARTGVENSKLLMQIASSGPDSDHATILQVYFGAITNATTSIRITTPYLILNESLVMALRTASMSGIKVQIILPGKADHFMVFWGSHSYYEILLEAGIEIYEYMNGFIHAKVLIVDDEIASIGTANMDMRSFNHNFELTAMIYDRGASLQASIQFDLDLAHSRRVSLEEFRHRSILKRTTESICKLFSPLL